jgi:hypothetical protein
MISCRITDSSTGAQNKVLLFLRKIFREHFHPQRGKTGPFDQDLGTTVSMTQLLSELKCFVEIARGIQEQELVNVGHAFQIPVLRHANPIGTLQIFERLPALAQLEL